MREPTWCRFCRTREIQPVKLIEPRGKKVRTAYLCPTCGEELSSIWQSKKKEAPHGRSYQP